jgi:hypothetical protein
MSRNIVATDLDLENGKISKEQLDELVKEADRIISGIENLQRRNKQEATAYMCCIKSTIILLISLLCLPFGITSVYYAFTDTSCVNQQAGNLYVNLKDFLAVDGILVLIYNLFTCLLISFSKNPFDKVDNITNNIIYKVSLFIGNMFSLSWTIVGAVIFWSLIDNKQCNKPIYNYTFALLVIKFVALLLSQLGNSKDKK